MLGHVGSYPYHGPMELTDPQRRTLDQLIGTERSALVPGGPPAAAARSDRGGRARARAARSAVAGEGEAERPRALRGEVPRHHLRGGAAVRALREERVGRAAAQGHRGGGGQPRPAGRARRRGGGGRADARTRGAVPGVLGRPDRARAGRRPHGGGATRDPLPGVLPAAQGASPGARARQRAAGEGRVARGRSRALRTDRPRPGAAGPAGSHACHAARHRPEDRERLSRVRRGHALLRARS